jgi:hypothetical protein
VFGAAADLFDRLVAHAPVRGGLGERVFRLQAGGADQLGLLAGDRAFGHGAGEHEVLVSPRRVRLAGVEVLIGGHRALQRVPDEQVSCA